MYRLQKNGEILNKSGVFFYGGGGWLVLFKYEDFSNFWFLPCLKKLIDFLVLKIQTNSTTDCFTGTFFEDFAKCALITGQIHLF